MRNRESFGRHVMESGPVRRRRVHRRWLARSTLALSTAAIVAVAAVLATTGDSSGPTAGRPTAPEPPAPAHRLAATLVSFDACSGYLAYMKRQALAVVGPYGLDLQVAGDPAGATPNRAPMSGAIASSTAAQGSAGAAAPTPAAPIPSGSPSFSTTNDQVAGVDEPDSVKTNGQMVVTLSGSTLRVLDLGARVIGSVQLTGDTGGGLLLDGHLAVVLSSSPSTQPGTVGYVPDNQWSPVAAGGAVAPGAAVSEPGMLPSPGPAAPAQARVTVVDLSDPSHPQVVRSFVFDGAVVAARLVDGQVRLVLRSDGPRLDFVTPAATGGEASATATNRALIAGSTISNWMPYWQIVDPDGSTTAREPLTTCQDVARPGQASGLSTVTVLSLDPSATSPGRATSVVAAGATVYATAGHIYVAGPTGPTADPYAGATQSGCCAILPPIGASTTIYDFSTTGPGAPIYEGSGSVPGWLIDSYAMDDNADGDLQVASTSHSSTGTETSQISVLQLAGGRLATIGTVGGLGPGEFIKTVRFIGALAYVVTYQSFDPLYVVDLAHPRAPALVGQLSQPGYSEFLYPLSDRLLIAVGVEIVSGEPSGLVVATYDVSDPAHPRQVDSSTLISGYQYVASGYDPHAFLYWPAADLALLAIPADDEYGTTGLSSGIAAYHVAPTGQLTRSATLDHGSVSMTRSVVIDGQVWAFSDTGVLTAQLADPAATTWHGY